VNDTVLGKEGNLQHGDYVDLKKDKWAFPTPASPTSSGGTSGNRGVTAHGFGVFRQFSSEPCKWMCQGRGGRMLQKVSITPAEENLSVKTKHKSIIMEREILRRGIPPQKKT